MREQGAQRRPQVEGDRAIVGGRAAAAGCLQSAREALDDAEAVLAFVRAGLRSRAIDPAQTLWVIDLAPGDGERAWRMLVDIARRAPPGPPIRYLAHCMDPVQRAALATRASLSALVGNGMLYLERDALPLPPHPLSNPPVVLGHGAFAAGAGDVFMHVGAERQLQRCDGDAWSPADRGEGLLRIASAYRDFPDGTRFHLPLDGMRMLAHLLDASGGRLLLRASDQGIHEAKRLASAETGGRVRVNFDALARWHRAQGGSVHQSCRRADGRVLHVALHEGEGGRLRGCLPEVLALPHPDDHVDLLQAIAAFSSPSSAQCRALLRATGNDPRAFDALQRLCPDAFAEPLRDGWGALAMGADTADRDDVPRLENDDG